MATEILDISSWEDVPASFVQKRAVEALENGCIVYLPALSFYLLPHERRFLTPLLCSGTRKNIGYDFKSDKLGGLASHISDQEQIKSMLRRFALKSVRLLSNIFPQYTAHVLPARTSFRPIEIRGRIPASFRKDDTRLHVDSFPANPTQGRRILRMFSNVNPDAQARIWRVGEPFAKVVEKFAPQVAQPFPGLSTILQKLCITRGYRTLYDHYMLNIHDAMKKDVDYQKTAPQTELQFPAGSTWFVYTDQVSHAAMAGQHVFEQTFHLPLHGLNNKNSAPQRVLEKFLDQSLINFV